MILSVRQHNPMIIQSFVKLYIHPLTHFVTLRGIRQQTHIFPTGDLVREQ